MHGRWEHAHWHPHTHAHSHAHAHTHAHHWMKHGRSSLRKEALLAEAAGAYLLFHLRLRLFVTNDVICYVIDIELLLWGLDWLHRRRTHLLRGHEVGHLVLLV